MGHLGVATRGWATATFALIAVTAIARPAWAGSVTLDNGVATEGHVNIDVDDYGAFGRQESPQADDNYYPPGERYENATFMAGVWLFVTTPGDVTSVVALTERAKLWAYQDTSVTSDGIVGEHTSLTRMVTTPISGGPTLATSAFQIADTTAQLQLDVALRQELVSVPFPEASLVQTYAITNNGQVAADLVFYAYWELDLYYNMDPAYDNDVVGAGPGLCYVYLHQPNSADQAMALRDGGGTAGKPFYVAAKVGADPDPNDPNDPAFTGTTADPVDQLVWNSWMTTPGMPTKWQNNVALVGYGTPGEDTTGFVGDAWIALEYHVTLAVGETKTINLDRHYGTIALACAGGASCGNGVVDSGEACDTMVDTDACNAINCSAPACGDGVVNMAAGEQCESIGVDSATCNGGTCAAPQCGDGYWNAAAGEMCDDGADTAACNLANCQPPACGDGIVNAAANEACESGVLCDLPTCTYNFTVGGGCVGCGAGGDANTIWLLACGVFMFRRRRARRA